MSVGRPVVSNPVGEVRWLFERYVLGELAEETAESMAAATLRLLQDPERAAALGQNARKIAEEEFSVAHQVALLHQWYFDIDSKIRFPTSVAVNYFV